MEHLLVESAVRGTVIAASVAAVLWATRLKAPALLHAMWTSVVIAMLLLPLWTQWGPQAPVHVLPQQLASAIVVPRPIAIASASMSNVQRTVSSFNQTETGSAVAWDWRDTAVLVYGMVAGLLLLRLVIGTSRAYTLVRRSVITHGRLTSAACTSPVTIGWLRPVVVLPETWREWSDAKLDAVLTHERAHVRRRDPLVQWLALLNRAIFWFHPVAWWIERRLSALAEQACDDAVLARGHDPQDYSEYLLEATRSLGRGGRVNLAGVFMPGAFLPQRIRRILDRTPMPRVSRTRTTITVAACLTASAVGVVATPARAMSQRAGATASRLIVRPIQPRWISPDSTLPQPVSLEWLDGDEWAFEVQSILTSEEMREYGELRGPQERDAFIERFWARRDPSPGTPPNEFRDEFIRRVQFARERFADPKSAATPGFDTDRGRVYLMFGPPDSIETQAAGADQIDEWRYKNIAAIGEDFRVRFSSARGTYCGYRIVSPAPIATVGGARAASVPALQFYPLGLVAISIPVEAARVAGARWELRNRHGVQVDNSQIGFMEGPASDPLSRHLSPSWLEMGIGCTHTLPADTYTLTTAVRFVTGQLQSETVTFNVE